MPRTALLPALFVFCALSSAWGAEADASGEAAERSRIAILRGQAQDRLDAELAACRERVARSDCERVAHSDHRQVRDDLRRQELALDAARRKRDAARRLHDIEQRGANAVDQDADKRASAARRQEDKRVRAEERAANREKRSAEKAASPPSETPEQARIRLQQRQAERAAEAQARRQAQADKRAQAAQHQADLEKKRSSRTKPPALPLPAAN